jgi:hypothetical protein
VLSRIMSALSCRSERRDTSTSPPRQNDRDTETTTGRNRATTTGRNAMIGAALVDTRDGSTGRNSRLGMESRQGTLDTAGRQLPDLPIPNSIANGGQRETRRRLSSVLDAVGLMD